MTTRKRRSNKSLTWHVKHAMQKVARATGLSAVLHVWPSDDADAINGHVKRGRVVGWASDEGGDEFWDYIEMIAERED